MTRASAAWATLALAFVVASLAAAALDPQTLSRLDWRRALADAEPWRAWTAALVHASGPHLAANAVGALLVGAYGVAARVPWRSGAAWLVAWPATQMLLLWLAPSLGRYVGLSGVLHAGVAVAALHLAVAGGVGRRRAIGAATLAVVVAKVLSEAPWDPALRPSQALGIQVAPAAHAAGLLAGTVASLAAEAVAAARRRRRVAPAWDRPVTDDPPAAAAPFSGPNPASTGTSTPAPAVASTAARAPGPRKARVDATAAGLMVACCAVWGIGHVAAKAAIVDVPPHWQVAVRCGGAALLVALWAAWRGVPLLARDRTLRAGLFAGVLFGLEFLCIFQGLTLTTASRMVVFLYVSPFVVALGMPFIARHETLSPSQLAGLVVAFGGVAWAFAEGFLRPAVGPHQWIGDALGLLAGVLWGATTLAIRATRLASASAEKTLLYQLGVTAVLATGVALAIGEPWPRDPPALAVAAVVFQTVIVTFASYLAWVWLIGRYPATQLSSFTLLTPVFGLVFGAWLLGEPVTAQLLIGLAAVVAGLWLVNRQPAVRPAD